MPAVDGTLTDEDVAAWLGVPTSDRVTAATGAARDWVYRMRSLTAPGEVFHDGAVHQGGVLYAGLLFQSRATPQGFAGYEEGGAGYGQSVEALYRARELVGSDPVTA